MKKSLLLFALAAGCVASAWAEIPDGWSVVPEEGSTVEKITELKVSKAYENSLDPYVNRSVKINGESIAITQKVSNDGGTMTMTLATPVEKSGTYTIVVPQGTFDYDYDWFSYEGTPNPELSWSVTVDNGEPPVPPTPEINVVASPASGETVKSLETVTLTFEGATGVTVADTEATATLKSLGSPVEGTTISFAAATEANAIVMTITPAVTVSGEYTVTVPDGMFNFTAEGVDAFASSEFKLNYTVKAPPVDGEKFVVDKIRYKVISGADKTAEVTWPADEADYDGLTTVPTSVEYEGETYTITRIGDLAFSEVTGIGEFTVPDGMVSIGEGAFWQSSLTSIEIPASVTAIYNDAFSECQKLTKFTLPVTATTLGEDLLYGCIQLKELNLPEGVTMIPDGFVQGAQQLEEVKIPSTVTKIGGFAFAECPELTTINIPEACTSIGAFAFAYCIKITTLPVPETVTSLGHGVFYQAGLTEAALPENITVIPDGTFQCCANLKEFTVSNNVTEIEKEAFYWCFALEKITLGEKVAKFGEKVFYGDDALKEVICLNPVPATGVEFTQSAYENATLTVPEGSLDAYKAADGWKEFLNIAEPTGIAAATADGEGLSVRIEGDTMYVSAGAEVSVCTASGVIIYRGAADTVQLPSRGIYIVSCGGRTVKVVY